MDRSTKEILVVIVTIIILAASVSYTKSLATVLLAFIAFCIVVGVNVIAKKIAAYHHDTDIEIRPWTLYRYGFRNDAHFKEPLPLSWIPIFLSLVTNAALWWLPITQFESKPKPERIARRHHFYRYYLMTEWDVGIIALSGLLTNLILGVILLFIDISAIQYIAKMNIYYAAWSLLPISNLDGTKIFFASTILWIFIAIITAIITVIAIAL